MGGTRSRLAGAQGQPLSQPKLVATLSHASAAVGEYTLTDPEIGAPRGVGLVDTYLFQIAEVEVAGRLFYGGENQIVGVFPETVSLKFAAAAPVRAPSRAELLTVR